jgi:hypothetical protein
MALIYILKCCNYQRQLIRLGISPELQDIVRLSHRIHHCDLIAADDFTKVFACTSRLSVCKSELFFERRKRQDKGKCSDLPWKKNIHEIAALSDHMP